MKLVTLTFLVSGLMLGGIANAQDDLQAKGEAVITKSCVMCHDTSMTPSFVDEAGVIDSAAIKANAAKISTRVSSTTRPMPPKSSPAFLQPTAQEKADLLAYMASLLVTTPVTPPATEIVPLSKLTVEPGFKIEVFAKATGARSLAVHSSGIVFAGTGGFSNVDPQGRVHAIVPTASGNKTVALATGLNNPNGIALNGNDLYVAESSRILLIKNAVATAQSLAAGSVVKAKISVIKSDLREQSNHHWKYLAIGPDNKLYVPVGADCNVCAEDREVGASIFRMNLDGTGWEQVSKGVRNTVGIAFHPVTGQLWFTDNGRDSLGDGLPADELNVAVNTTAIQDFGFPYCFGNSVVDPTFGKNFTCSEAQFTKPAVELGAHVAALGMDFYTGTTFPAKYDNAIFIAEHGSWNSSKKVGYRLSIVEPKTSATTGKTTYSYRPFISGFATATTNWGRPVDVKNYIDGSLLLSDDASGLIYKISPVATVPANTTR